MLSIPQIELLLQDMRKCQGEDIRLLTLWNQQLELSANFDHATTQASKKAFEKNSTAVQQRIQQRRELINAFRERIKNTEEVES